MANIIWRLLHRGRPKGRRFFPVTITLTQEQIDYLQRQPNASELIRKILDDLIKLRGQGEEKLSIIALKMELEPLDSQIKELKREKMHYHYEHKSEMFKSFFNERGLLDFETDDKGEYIPLTTHEAKVHLKILTGYDKAIEALKQKREDIERKILESE